LWDGKGNIGAVGDWLHSPCLEGAWCSGYRLANWIASESCRKTDVGLEGGKFVAAGSASGIGDFGEENDANLDSKPDGKGNGKGKSGNNGYVWTDDGQIVGGGGQASNASQKKGRRWGAKDKSKDTAGY